MLHTIGLDETKTLTIRAREFYSSEKISVVAGEKYEFSCPPNAHWVDWFVSSTPDGYFNPLSLMLGQRVKHTKCFCLCGAYNDNDDGAFAIGSTTSAKWSGRAPSLSLPTMPGIIMAIIRKLLQ